MTDLFMNFVHGIICSPFSLALLPFQMRKCKKRSELLVTIGTIQTSSL